MDKLTIHFPLAVEQMNQLAASDQPNDREHAALNAMVQIMNCLEDLSPLYVLTSLLAHFTYAQPDRDQSVKYILEGVFSGWRAMGDQDILNAMDEKRGHVLQ